jgi:hypothetical protein
MTAASHCFGNVCMYCHGTSATHTYCHLDCRDAYIIRVPRKDRLGGTICIGGKIF